MAVEDDAADEGRVPRARSRVMSAVRRASWRRRELPLVQAREYDPAETVPDVTRSIERVSVSGG